MAESTWFKCALGMILFLVSCGLAGCATAPTETPASQRGRIVLRTGDATVVNESQAKKLAIRAMKKRGRSPRQDDLVEAVAGVVEGGKTIWHVSCRNPSANDWQVQIDGFSGRLIMAIELP